MIPTRQAGERVDQSDPPVGGFAFSGLAMTPPGGSLSPRQLECLQLLAHGFTIKEIEARLGITNRGVRDLQERAYEKLGVYGPSARIDAFRAIGWLTPPELPEP